MAGVFVRSLDAITDPTGLPILADLSADLFWDFNADDITGDDTDTVDSWVSAAGTMAGMTLSPAGTTLPALSVDDTLPNHKAVRFTNGRLASEAAAFTLPEPCTYALLVKIRETTGSAQWLFAGNGSEQRRLTVGSTGTGLVFSGSSSTELTGTSKPIGEWGVVFALAGVGGVAGGASLKTDTGRTDGTITVRTPTTYRLGQSNGGTSPAHADIARSICYSRELSDDEMVALRFQILDDAGLPTT